MPLSLTKRFEGHEQEIIRDIRLYGNNGAMMKWGASVIAWEKYSETLREVSTDKDNKAGEKIYLTRPLLADRKSLAEELVEQFTHKVVTLEAKCRDQSARIDCLERQLAAYRNHNEEKLADKMMQALEVCR